MSEATIVYAVFAEVRGGIGHDWLGAYSSRERAQRFIDAQDAQLQSSLVIWEVELDADPSDPYWVAPKGMAAAFHAIAALPEDAVPNEREPKKRSE